MVQISVFGIGYVGAVSCGCLVSLGHKVVAVDISPQKIGLLTRACLLSWKPGSRH